eukprot:TRINITY_DN32673_c0_g1_i1.p1 TRINITY_DN32673_c0_g1~~TRINITY_DN32673_c0_g1_i1.p1  ORF type:complete len:577 (-),score=64.70 TRINITY_DN32673_c0_g1_i1:157-1788(-)
MVAVQMSDVESLDQESSQLIGESEDLQDIEDVSSSSRSRRRAMLSVMLVALVSFGAVACYGQLWELFGLRPGTAVQKTGLGALSLDDAIRQVPGVNLGGWFVLEDWFFSGRVGNHVMSEDTRGQGRCLPPLLPQVEEPWPSEGVLTSRLNHSMGWKKTARIFDAHRRTFIQESDVRGIASTGIRTIRLPLTWAAFADALGRLDKNVYGSHDPNTDTVIVPDPFYHHEIAFATIPRALIKRFINLASKHGLKVILDLHAFPGGSQDGTYNGIWPHRPVFWNQHSHITQESDSKLPLRVIGMWISSALIKWVEDLDSQTRKGIQGLTLMNEPAHMNAVKNYASEQDVLQWLGSTADVYRKSKLPSQGIRLYVNLIDTAFKQFEWTAVPWYKNTFTQQERNTWVVADTHFYTAWSAGSCDGRTEAGGGYTCDMPLRDILWRVQGCIAQNTQRLRRIFGEGLMSVSEFSVGTFQDARAACKDTMLLKAFLEAQLNGFLGAGIEPFFWTWRMPYGEVFEPGWSLKWLRGLEDKHEVDKCVSSYVSVSA